MYLTVDCTVNDRAINEFLYNGNGTGRIVVTEKETGEVYYFLVTIPFKYMREHVWHRDEDGIVTRK